MAEFLLEVFSEEIPARMQVKAASDIKELILKGLKDNSVEVVSAEEHSTPRRIVVAINGLPKKQPDILVEKRGPRTDAPQTAVEGFLKANNIKIEQCTKEETDKGSFWFYRENVKGIATEEVLLKIIEEVLKNFVWPKSMRWQSGTKQWVRPMHGILALFDGKVVPVKFEIGGSEPDIIASNKVCGHRFLAPKPFTVSNFEDYKKKLRKTYVIIEREERKKIIMQKAETLASSENMTINSDESLVEEIIGLVEWPVPLMGSFEKEFLEVPSEVLISTMRSNQKYLGLLDTDGKLANKFIVVANTETADEGRMVIAGNEKVVRARLSDAKFFWDQDKKHKLESLNGALKQIVFHKKLGTVYEKIERLQKLSKVIAETINCNTELAQRTALLCKADLSSGVVLEFPEVQGIMGRYYAIHDNENSEVANAIADHYKPIGASDDCPTYPISICAAIADKLDTLVGFFAVNEKPTGSKDPFALRRAALGVIRIILENKLEISLDKFFRISYDLYKETIKDLAPIETVIDDLSKFFIERLKVSLKDKGLSFDLIDAVLGSSSNKHNLNEVHNLTINLKEFLTSENGANLITAYKRAVNILRIEEGKDKKNFNAGELNIGLLKEHAEIALEESLTKASIKIKKDFDEKNFIACMNDMAEIRKEVDTFFDQIMVNDENFRTNRLCLLSKLRDTMNIIADFSKIEA